jgi:Cft2 family RNA processing exonuclease
MDIVSTLEERGSRYGNFLLHSKITQEIKDAMKKSPNWNGGLSDDMIEALEMIAHKIGRILNGDPSYADSWHDIAGYATLVEQRLSE